MRDLLTHAYDHVDIDDVWNAAQSDIPSLISRIELLTQELTHDASVTEN